MKIDLIEFVHSGRLGPISLGQSSEEVRKIFGEPDTTGGTSRKKPKPSIHLYGDVEFGFEVNAPWLLDYIQLQRHSSRGSSTIRFPQGTKVEACGLRFGMSVESYLAALTRTQIPSTLSTNADWGLIQTPAATAYFQLEDRAITNWICPRQSL